MKSVMTHQFSQVPKADIQRSSFNRDHGYKTTFDADFLYPVLVDDIIPGDSFSVEMSHFVRLATPLHPIMDNMYIDTFFFFVPYRLLWDNWERFCGAQDDPGDSIDFTIPVISTHTVATGDLLDYMGLPIGNPVANVSALPLRAYYLIWSEWFRDENLQNSATINTGNGPDGDPGVGLVKRGKRHDYFTSALPSPQKGSAVDLPLGSTAPVQGTGSNSPTFENSSAVLYGALQTSAANPGNVSVPNSLGGGADFLHWRDPQLEVDLSSATSATINDIRLAFQTQRLLERDARGGTRYVETLKAHFGVTSPDFRLQRPEFLGGGSSPVNVTPVAQTSGQATPATDDQLGQLAGIGTSAGTHGFTKSFVEHGVLIGLVNARADLTYSQGIERYWSKSTRYDFYYPVLANIGEQSVLNKEIFHQNTSADDEVFGYQERYAEYRYKPSRLTGLFRPDASGTLASWTLTEDFSSLPSLGATFIQSNLIPPLDRAIQIPAEPQFIGDFYFQMRCARPMPLYGVPGNMDRF